MPRLTKNFFAREASIFNGYYLGCINEALPNCVVTYAHGLTRSVCSCIPKPDTRFTVNTPTKSFLLCQTLTVQAFSSGAELEASPSAEFGLFFRAHLRRGFGLLRPIFVAKESERISEAGTQEETSLVEL